MAIENDEVDGIVIFQIFLFSHRILVGELKLQGLFLLLAKNAFSIVVFVLM